MAHFDVFVASILTLVFCICRTIILSSPTVDPKTMAPGVRPSLYPRDHVMHEDMVILAQELSLIDAKPAAFNDTQWPLNRSILTECCPFWQIGWNLLELNYKRIWIELELTLDIIQPSRIARIVLCYSSISSLRLIRAFLTHFVKVQNLVIWGLSAN